ncbi:MAG: TetR/AcrR family transcriptional regulator [Hyphomicrobiales bacterium]|nr:TetR/AcrR family transcriptional regulator [Hyphomicrobiales bacterium]
MPSKEPVIRTRGERGPAEHERRRQILEAAHEHFRQYGFGKTSVADLAGAIGVTPAYVYRFFDSKRAIGEAICAETLGIIIARLNAMAAEPISASEKLQRFYGIVLEGGCDLLLHERKMHDLVLNAVTQHWDSVAGYRAAQVELLRGIVAQGRASGEFETETELQDIVRGLAQSVVPFAHPLLLEDRDIAELRSGAAIAARMALRSLRR